MVSAAIANEVLAPVSVVILMIGTASAGRSTRSGPAVGQWCEELTIWSPSLS